MHLAAVWRTDRGGEGGGRWVTALVQRGGRDDNGLPRPGQLVRGGRGPYIVFALFHLIFLSKLCYRGILV